MKSYSKVIVKKNIESEYLAMVEHLQSPVSNKILF